MGNIADTSLFSEEFEKEMQRKREMNAAKRGVKGPPMASDLRS